jgi:Protein of unknown function (DUF1501)
MRIQTDEAVKQITRRHFFRDAGFGIGALALAELVGNAGDGARPAPHFPPRAKRIIYLFMAGGPSSVDLFDSKPKLRELNGQPCPESLLQGERFAFIKGVPRLLGSPHDFERHGRSGLELSSLLPHLGSVADDIAVIHSMQTTQFNHAPAQIFMSSGHQIVGRPSMGAWLSYGLGSENRDLPGFVVLLSGRNNPEGGKSCWGNGFLPTTFQGVEFRNSGDPVLYLSNPPGVTTEARRRTIDSIVAINRRHFLDVGDPETVARIASYELAYRMQTSVPELMDISREPARIHELYGTEPGKASFANNCLLARRLVERGVRFVQLFHNGWDHHGTSADSDIKDIGLPRLCRETDQASAALLRDLKDRGLLDSTLVVWGGEFGRTPMNEERSGSKFLGRDHHPHAFTMWVAGGGIRPGQVIGRTDEFGYRVVEEPVPVHDLHATVLHLMGIDHTRLTFRFLGRDYRLTDVSGNVVKKLLA